MSTQIKVLKIQIESRKLSFSYSLCQTTLFLLSGSHLVFAFVHSKTLIKVLFVLQFGVYDQSIGWKGFDRLCLKSCSKPKSRKDKRLIMMSLKFYEWYDFIAQNSLTNEGTNEKSIVFVLVEVTT